MRRLAVVPVLALLLLGACSNGDGDADGNDRRDVATTSTTTAPATAASLVAEVDGDAVRKTLEAIVGTRVTNEERSRARGVLADRLRAAGLQVAEEPFGTDGVNLVATTTGSASGPPIQLSAHYDTVPGSPGADDDGSGVAAVVEAARVLAGAGLSRPVQDVLFDLEERGLLGSRHRAATAGAILAGINLDMVGFTCETPGCQVEFPDIAGCLDAEGSRNVGVGIAAVVDEQSGPLLDAFLAARDAHVRGLHVGSGRLAGHGECLDDTRRSDHAPYWDAGVPVLFLTDTANFRNPNYHQPSDALPTVDLDLVTDVTRAVVATAYELAKA
jgi:Zn-dependent M28 family amino/carboxypeptidase